ncbi:IGHMBP2 family helicase [Hippea jasoniae]|uniref:IGHMBP2 family helicase n=1 Tax=Hippea jasoniae TaxID=944479 RepID=UPI00055543E2|nr:IGHMBP2 family helicase [Hippea jasoniae]
MALVFDDEEHYISYFLNLIELERKAEKEFHIAEIKNLSAKKRQSLGRAILNAKIKLMGRFLDFIIYRFSFRSDIEPQIKVGDIVLISKGEPLKLSVEATVSSMAKNYIEVMTKTKIFKSKFYRIDLFVNDITFKRMKHAVENLNYSLFDKDIILGKQSPEPQTSSISSSNLNNSQNDALQKAINSKLFLIHGPPGTGKTTTLTEIIKLIEDERILVCADSNVAIDNLMEKLKDQNIVRIGHPAKINDELLKYSIDFVIREDKRYKKIEKLLENIEKLKNRRDREFKKPSPSLRRGLSNEEILTLASSNRSSRGLKPSKIKKMAGWIELNSKISNLYEEKERLLKKITTETLKNARIVFATNSAAGSEYLEDFYFDVLFLDEAAQATEPSALIPISKAQRVIMAGDHKQLPPTVLSDKAKRLNFSIFERFTKIFSHLSHTLSIQYRMNKVLNDFPSCEFYNCILKPHPSVENIKLSDIANISEFIGFDAPVVFFDTQGRFLEASKEGSFSKYNPLEAQFVKKLADELLKLGVKEEQIGIITPYKDHEEYLKSLIKNIEIKSIDGFQGREKELIIISLVRANENEEIGFLKDKRRLNVAITRAKRKLIIVGDSFTLSTDKTYANLIDYVRKNGIIKTI